MASWLLQDKPHGAYTCARAFEDGSGIVQRDFHIERMKSSMKRVFGDDYTEDHERDVVKQVESILDHPLEPNVMLVIAGYLKNGQACIESKLFPTSFKRVVLNKVVVGGGNGRPNPTAKHTTWIEIRKPLEKLKADKEADEVILVEQDANDTLLLEGLTTNIFILWKDGRTIQTAPRDKGLSGSMRDVIIQVAKKQGFEILESCPRWSEKSKWQAAFITNVTKAGCTVKRLEYWNDPSDFVDLETENDDVSRLTDAVDEFLAGK